MTVISNLNSVTQALGANAAYVGVSESVSGYSSVTVTLRGSIFTAGTLYIGFSATGSSWAEIAYPVANPTTMAPVTAKVTDLYYRVRYVNGATALASIRVQSTFIINPTAGSQGPPGAPGPAGPAGPPGPAAVNEVRQLITLTNSNIFTKSFALSGTPLVPANLRLYPAGGLKQFFGVDFTVAGSTVSWNGFGLDTFLTAGDLVEVAYFT